METPKEQKCSVCKAPLTYRDKSGGKRESMVFVKVGKKVVVMCPKCAKEV